MHARVVVISPHPDDDVIGCGGTLARLAARGARINVIYVTDGSASHVRSRRFPPAILRDLREGEARDALRLLGIRRAPHFLRAPDGRLAELAAAERHALIHGLACVLQRYRPQLLFVPWQRDPHADHIATAALVEAALSGSLRRPAVYAYGVWLAIRGTAADAPEPRVITVSEIALTAREVAGKRAAIMQHRSQTTDLVDDDPDGFRIDGTLLEQWLAPVERFYRASGR